MQFTRSSLLLWVTAGFSVVISYFIFTRCSVCINVVWMNAAVIRNATGIPAYPAAIFLVILFTAVIWRIIWVTCRLLKRLAVRYW